MPLGARLHYISIRSYVISHSYISDAFHPKGVYHFNLLGLEIAATFPRLVATAISGGFCNGHYYFTGFSEYFVVNSSWSR